MSTVLTAPERQYAPVHGRVLAFWCRQDSRHNSPMEGELQTALTVLLENCTRKVDLRCATCFPGQSSPMVLAAIALSLTARFPFCTARESVPVSGEGML